MSYAGSSFGTSIRKPNPPEDPDVVGIKVGGVTLSGWQEVRITRPLEGCPPSFDIGLTEKYPTQTADIVIKPGDPCQVMIGSDVVITGYVDRYVQHVDADTHSVHIIGRGMCEDLVDCSAMFSTMETNNTTIVSLANKLTEPFGIKVRSPDGDSSTIPQFNVILTETPYEIIERVARWANFLVYENTDGSLNIARVGDTKMASGFSLGGPDGNVQVAGVSLSMDDRFTDLFGAILSTAFLTDNSVPALGSLAPTLPFAPGAYAFDSSFPNRSDGKVRTRPLLIMCESNQNDPKIIADRIQWDMARRVGRSQAVNLTVDSWRDASGTLWQPNSLATVNLPALKLVNVTWVIGAVTFIRDERGTTTEVSLMPREAFVPAPDVLLPYDFQLAQELPNGGANNFGPAPR